ncbi:MAG: hypothetical protein KDB90_13060 [Planctomycetes bacterium]|nr:hypothetical protein [Planctomycetota bacterium]
MTRWTTAIAVLIIAVACVNAEDAAKAEFGLVVYKLGEKYATDDKAGETIDSLADYLDKNVAGADFTRLGVRNKPADALKLFADEKKPVGVAIVSPGFYFSHKADLKLTALAEAQRGGKDGEQYSLVGAAEMKEYPAGKKVATSMTADLDWLNKAVLRAPEGAKPIEWVQYDNLADAGYEIIDKEDGAPDFVLVDRATLEIFAKDSDLKSLKTGLQSELLPQDLVVEVDGRLGDKRADLKKVLGALDQNEAGKKLGENLQSPKFPAPVDARLEKVAKWYDTK